MCSLLPLLCTGLPVTINPDDAALWDASGVTFDWFQTFLASSNTTDLSTLKQLALNSITFSSITQAERQGMMAVWEQSWSKYIEWLVSQ